MNEAVEIMLSSIRAQVCGADSTLYGEISDENLCLLYKLSKEQDMAHIVASELEKQKMLKDGDEISEKFRKQQLIAVLRYERISYELGEICAVLEKNKICHMPLKGSVMRRYYGEPWMRTSSDIDILVKKEELDQAVRALSDGLGYKCEKFENTPRLIHDVSMFSPSGVHLELHFETVEEKRACNANEVLSDIWEYAIPRSGFSYSFDTRDDMFYFYHVAHMAKHFEESGCGIRFFLDMWLLNTSADFDRNEREKLLQKGGLLDFEKAASKMAEIWFSKEEYDDTSRIMEAFVLNSGIYGSAHNKVAFKVKKEGKAGYVLHKIFPPYTTMKRIFPVLEKHKVLLPVYYVVKWFKIAFRGDIGRSVSQIKGVSNIGEQYSESVDKMFDRIGLTKGYEFYE